MAEVAGLVIGGVALAGLFDTCMNLLRTIDSGRNFERDYQQAVLKVVVLSERLNRWERTYRASGFQGTAKDGETAKHALEEIYRCLQEAKDAGQPYLPREAKVAGRNTDVARVTDSIKALVRRKKPARGASFLTKSSWATTGKDKLNAIIKNLEWFIPELERISSDAASSSRQKAADQEALEIIHPSAIEEPETSLPILQKAAMAVDPELGQAMKSRGHTYNNIRILDEAKSIQGNYVAEGAKVTGYGSDYSNITISGKARAFNGDQYGGKSPMENLFR